MEISFDFDGTIDRPRVQEIAADHIRTGDTVWIITRRFNDEADEVLAVADELGILHNRVIFTNGEWKFKTIKNLPIDIHYDDKLTEVFMIERFTDTKAILI